MSKRDEALFWNAFIGAVSLVAVLVVVNWVLQNLAVILLTFVGALTAGLLIGAIWLAYNANDHRW